MQEKKWFALSSPCKKFSDHEQLFEGLRQLDNAAILCLQTKAMPMVRKVVKNYGLSADKADEILNQSTLIFLQKIDSGAYQFQGHAPQTYLIEVAKRVAHAATRTKKMSNESLEDHYDLADHHLESEEQSREAAALVSQFLAQLGDSCRQVIQLHHIDGFRDEEVIQQKLTPYSTIASLKMKRSDCMKKLIKIAQRWKTSRTT